jgi:hypothetical protein
MENAIAAVKLQDGGMIRQERFLAAVIDAGMSQTQPSGLRTSAIRAQNFGPLQERFEAKPVQGRCKADARPMQGRCKAGVRAALDRAWMGIAPGQRRVESGSWKAADTQAQIKCALVYEYQSRSRGID